MARLFIPTRNRPTSLAAVVDYLAKFYPATEVVIADGSSEDFARQNARNMAAAGERLTIDYRQYSYDMPFFERILDVMRGESDRYFIMGSDDDYPMMDALDRAEQRLAETDGAVTAMGALLNLFVREDGALIAAIQRARPLVAKDAQRRARMLAQWPFATTYAVTDRHHLIERYERARFHFLPGYFDYVVAMHDCIAGKVVALPEMGFVASRNFNHSYLREGRGISAAERAAEIFGVARLMSDDLKHYAGLEGAEADTLAETLVRRRVAEQAGANPHFSVGFTRKAPYRDPVVQSQLQEFDALLTAGTDTHKRFGARMRHIVDGMFAASRSDDNANEPSSAKNFDAQMRGEDGDQRRKSAPVGRRASAAQADRGDHTGPWSITVDPGTLARQSPHDERIAIAVITAEPAPSEDWQERLGARLSKAGLARGVAFIPVTLPRARQGDPKRFLRIRRKMLKGVREARYRPQFILLDTSGVLNDLPTEEAVHAVIDLQCAATQARPANPAHNATGPAPGVAPTFILFAAEPMGAAHFAMLEAVMQRAADVRIGPLCAPSNHGGEGAQTEQDRVGVLVDGLFDVIRDALRPPFTRLAGRGRWAHRP